MGVCTLKGENYMMFLKGPHGSMDENLDDGMLWKRYVTEVTNWREVDPRDQTTWPEEGTFFWGLLNAPGHEAVDYCYRQGLPNSDELAINNAWYDRQDATGIAAWCPISQPEPPEKYTVIDDEARRLVKNDELGKIEASKRIGHDWVRFSECLPQDKLAADYGRRLLWFYDKNGVIRQGVYAASGFVHFAFSNVVSIRNAFDFLVAWRVVMKPDILGGYYEIEW